MSHQGRGGDDDGDDRDTPETGGPNEESESARPPGSAEGNRTGEGDGPFDHLPEEGADVDNPFERLPEEPAADDPFERVDTAPAAAADVEAVADDAIEAVVPKHQYCEPCEHFSGPPEVRCTHPGTEIRELVDMDHFRVVDCPVVAEHGSLDAAPPAPPEPAVEED